MSEASTDREIAELAGLRRQVKLANFFLFLIAIGVAGLIEPAVGVIAAFACAAAFVKIRQ